MEYQDYDLLLKYHLSQERLKSTYFGDSSVYLDGKVLEIFPESGDKVNGKTPLFVFGTVVYLHYTDKFLILEQKKEDKVVDTLVGLGGKVRPILGTIVQSQEKNDIDKILKSYESGQLDTAEEVKYAAAREVMEETSTYKKDENGLYTHEIEKHGISINPKLLNKIGISRIRITLPDKTECWLIYNYIYELSKEEYDFIEQNVSKDNREGTLQWLTKEEVLPHMSNSDRIILENHDKNISVSEIRDSVNNQNITRFVFDINSHDYYGTIVNGSLIYVNDDACNQLINVEKRQARFRKK